MRLGDRSTSGEDSCRVPQGLLASMLSDAVVHPQKAPGFLCLCSEHPRGSRQTRPFPGKSSVEDKEAEAALNLPVH